MSNCPDCVVTRRCQACCEAIAYSGGKLIDLLLVSTHNWTRRVLRPFSMSPSAGMGVKGLMSTVTITPLPPFRGYFADTIL